MPALPSSADIYRAHASAQDIIKRALRLLGILASGEPVPADQLTDSLEAFNDMVDSWNTEKLTISVRKRNTFVLSAKNPFDIGPGAIDFDAARPNRIEQGDAWLTGGSLGAIERELDVQTVAQWERRYMSGQSTIPSALRYEPISPTGRIWFDVIPDLAYTLVLYLEQMLTQVTMDGITTELGLAPGFKDALVHNLAIRLAPEYGRTATPEIINGAVQGKATLKRMNQRSLDIVGDPEIRANRGGFNIFSGDYV